MREMTWEHADIVRVTGASSSAVSQWLGKGSKPIHTIKPQYAEPIEQASGFSALWVAQGIGPERVDESARRNLVVADLLRNANDLRNLARTVVIARTDITPEKRAEYLAALDRLDAEARKRH